MNCCRRDFLMRSASGLSALALSSLLQGADSRDPLAARPPDHPPTAKSVIWLFMEGGPSHIDLFDPKPELTRLAGQPMPPSYGKVVTAMGTGSNTTAISCPRSPRSSCCDIRKSASWRWTSSSAAARLPLRRSA